MQGQKTEKKKTPKATDSEDKFRKEILKHNRQMITWLEIISDKLEYLCADRRRNSGG